MWLIHVLHESHNIFYYINIYKNHADTRAVFKCVADHTTDAVPYNLQNTDFMSYHKIKRKIERTKKNSTIKGHMWAEKEYRIRPAQVPWWEVVCVWGDEATHMHTAFYSYTLLLFASFCYSCSTLYMMKCWKIYGVSKRAVKIFYTILTFHHIYKIIKVWIGLFIK